MADMKDHEENYFVIKFSNVVCSKKIEVSHLAYSVSIAIVRVNWSALDAKAETTVVTSARGGTGSTTRVNVAGPLPPPRIPSQWPQHPQGIFLCSRTDTEPLYSVLRPLLYIFYKILHLTHVVSAAILVLLVQLVLRTCDLIFGVIYRTWQQWLWVHNPSSKILLTHQYSYRCQNYELLAVKRILNWHGCV